MKPPLDSGAKEIMNDDPKYEELDLENKQHLKRMNKFWICNYCASSKSKKENKYSEPKMKRIEINGYKILVPCQDIQNNNTEIDMETLVLVPKNSQAVKIRPDNYSLNMYDLQDLDNKIISTHYQSRLSKYHQRKMNCETYEGVISNRLTKEIAALTPIVDDSKIRYSDAWHSKKRNTIYSYFQQFGQMSVAFNFNIKLNNIETMATLLLSAGKVITLNFEGNQDDEYSTTYTMHNHGDDQNCSSSCIQEELKNFDAPLLPKSIPTYNASVSQKQSAFIENFVKNKNNPFNSNDYYCGISYSLDGTANIFGLLWTNECSQFNKDLSALSLTGETFNSDNFLSYIQRNILTECNLVDIQNILNTSSQDAARIKDLVMQHQVNMNMTENLPLPSYECFLTVFPSYRARVNISRSEEFASFCRKHLINLSNIEKETLSTYEWLDILTRKCKFNLLYNDSIIEIEIEDMKIHFVMEERLSNLIQDYGCFIGELV